MIVGYACVNHFIILFQLALSFLSSSMILPVILFSQIFGFPSPSLPGIICFPSLRPHKPCVALITWSPQLLVDSPLPDVHFPLRSLLFPDTTDAFNLHASSGPLHEMSMRFTLILTIRPGVARLSARNEDCRLLRGSLPIFGYMTSRKSRILELIAT